MGTLYIVATPIGNLGDITLRAIETLKSVDYILCEDSRVTGRLLNHLQVEKKMISFNDFNEDAKTSGVIADLISGKNIALVSDAGTPLISDPGYKLVREAIKSNIVVDSIPGPTAVIDALTLSGLAPDKFLYIGYLPKKEGKKKELIEKIMKIKEEIKSTVIIYESPYRVLKTLEMISVLFGDINVVVCRELTKVYQEVNRGDIEEVINNFKAKTPKGEYVILI